MSCQIETLRRWTVIALTVLLGACSGSSDLESHTRGAGPQPFPPNHKAELLSFFKSYLNDPREVRTAAMAEPVQRTIGGRQRYVSCVRYNARDSRGAYSGVRERAVLYVDGRLDRLIEEEFGDACSGVTYAPFPEMEKLTR